MTLIHSDSSWQRPIRAVRHGLPFTAFEAVQGELGLTREDLCQVLRIPLRTLARRRTEQCFSPEESDRLSRAQRLCDRCAEVLGSPTAARAWLTDANLALGGETPVSLLDTDAGTQVVLDLLGRIEHGIGS